MGGECDKGLDTGRFSLGPGVKLGTVGVRHCRIV